MKLKAVPGGQLQEVRLEIVWVGGEQAEERVLALPGHRQLLPLPLIPPVGAQQTRQRILLHSTYVATNAEAGLDYLIMGHSHYHQGWGEGGEVQWKIKRYCMYKNKRKIRKQAYRE
jgi:hypothetical protein